MKEKRVVLIFWCISLFLFNPYFLSILISDSPFLNSNNIIGFYVFLYFLFSTLVFFLYYKTELFQKLFFSKLTLLTFSCCLMIFLIILINYSFKNSVLISGNSNNNDLSNTVLFPPNQVAHYKTTEFEYWSKTNRIGMRDNEIDIVEDANKVKILCLGDSFTYGWGVDLNSSWPKRLEHYLNLDRNQKYVVYNCGKGGASTYEYYQIAQKYNSILKPDIILIGLLQLDDLAQVYENWFKNKISNSITNSIIKKKKEDEKSKTFLDYFIEDLRKTILGNIQIYFSKFHKNDSIEIRTTNKSVAIKMYSEFNNYQKLKFDLLDQKLKQMYFSGDINPNLVHIAVNFSDRDVVFSNPSNFCTKIAIREMKKDFVKIKKVFSGKKIYVLNIPSARFVKHINKTFPFDIRVNHKSIDSIYNKISHDLDLNYIDFTKEFTDLNEKEKYYFQYDGHFTSYGYDFLAHTIFDKIHFK
jgi:lysophospholipase L1-like esterase